jgi:hypothetical protein
MPANTQKLQAPEPLGVDPATRASILAMIDKIDEQAALEPFLVRQADCTVSGGTLSVAYGKGQTRFASGVVVFAAGAATFPAAATSTTYRLVAKSDGTVVLKTSGAVTVGELILWEITTANPVATGTLVLADRRAWVPSSDAFAAGGLPADSVTATQIAPGAVGVGELATGAKPPTVCRLMALA